MKLIETQKFLKKLELQEFPQPEIVQLSYPVLLCHGYGALASVIKPSPMHEVCMLMRKHGVIAFAPNIVPYAKIETRAEQWVKKIEQLCEKYNFEKVHVIAHSMAGLDMRYALNQSDIHTKVASLTTLASPHRGTSLAELILTTPELLQEKLGEVFDWFGNSMYPKGKSDAVGAVQQLTREYVCETFNPANPDHEAVPYFSYSAAVGKGTKDPLNPIYRYQNQHIFENEGPNDSFVSVESAKWGSHIKTAPLSHLEQIRIAVSKDRTPKYEGFWFGVLEHISKEQEVVHK
jgi:triacylglycerol lipase